jgi:uncharacterized membrane protein
MQQDKQLITSLMTALVAVIVMTLSTNARAVDGAKIDTSNLEKCFGVVKAGQNDCDTNLGPGSCTPSVIDASPTEWIYLPKGVCEKLVGGSLTPGGSATNSNPAVAPTGNMPTGSDVYPGKIGVDGAENIDSGPIMQDDMILNGGAGLNGKSNGSQNAPAPDSENTNNSGTDLNKY